MKPPNIFDGFCEKIIIFLTLTAIAISVYVIHPDLHHLLLL